MANILDVIEQRLSNIEAMMLDLQKPTLKPQDQSKTGTATRQQAADYLNITLPTLNEYTKSGKIKGQRIGNRVLYKWADLDAALTAIKTKIGGIPL